MHSVDRLRRALQTFDIRRSKAPSENARGDELLRAQPHVNHGPAACTQTKVRGPEARRPMRGRFRSLSNNALELPLGSGPYDSECEFPARVIPGGENGFLRVTLDGPGQFVNRNVCIDKLADDSRQSFFGDVRQA